MRVAHAPGAPVLKEIETSMVTFFSFPVVSSFLNGSMTEINPKTCSTTILVRYFAKPSVPGRRLRRNRIRAVSSLLLLKSKTPPSSPMAGMTLLELIIASTILLILSSAALPIVRYTIVEQKETELRRDLQEMRDAIDRYKDLADQGKIRVEAGTEGYPPDLETLVKGLDIGAGAQQKTRFLRRIPRDPMTGKFDWNLCAVQDDTSCSSWGGNDVFDVRSKSKATALDGTRYSDW
jgi:general secretion pathway protein G